MSKAEVDAWMDAYDNPMKPVVQKVRKVLLAADTRLEECIKWKSPTFAYQGNLASFNPRSKKHASLMFHTGAQIPGADDGAFPSFEGTGDVARYIKFESVADVDAKKQELVAIVKAWMAMKDG